MNNLTESGSFDFPKSLWDEAAPIVKVWRTRTSYNPSEYDRGSKQEGTNWLGVIGELAMHHYLKSIGVNFSAPRMIANGPIKGYDFKIGDKTYDVKGTWEHGAHYFVGIREHRLHKAQYYVFLKLRGGEKGTRFTYLVVPWEIVEKWPERILQKLCKVHPFHLEEYRFTNHSYPVFIPGQARVRGEQVRFQFSDSADTCWHCHGTGLCLCAGCTFQVKGSVLFETAAVLCGACKGAKLLCWAS